MEPPFPPPPPPPNLPFEQSPEESKASSSTSEPKSSGNPFAKSQRKLKLTRTFYIVVGSLIAIVAIALYIYFSTRGGIVILEPQNDVTVTLNDQPVAAKQEKGGLFIPSYPGVYRLKITAPQYLPYTQDVRIGRGQTIYIRPIFSLLPNQQSTTAGTVDFVHPSLDQLSVNYLGNNRQTMYRMDIAKQVEIPLTDQALQNVHDVQWSLDPEVALIVQSDGTYLREIPKYNFDTQHVVKIAGTEISSPVWDPNNTDRIAFTYNPPSGEHSLVFSDKRISSLDRKADIGSLTNPRLIWAPNSMYIALIPRSSDPSQNNVWIFNTTDGSLKQVTTEGNITNASFSSTGDILIYESSTSDASNPYHSVLNIIHTDGSQKQSLNLAGKVGQVAWKDSTSFFLPDTNNNSLDLFTVTGSKESIPFSFPDSTAVQGMFYFSTSKTLIFYTAHAIYTANLSL